jgi:hypothetical protein
MTTCANCGQPGAPCCPGSTCAGNGCCYNGSCVAEAQACSSTSTGTGGGSGSGGCICTAGKCANCGGSGQPGCGTTCSHRFTCRSSVCSACGDPGEPCCTGSADSDRCAAGTIFTSTSSSTGLCATPTPAAPRPARRRGWAIRCSRPDVTSGYSDGKSRSSGEPDTNELAPGGEPGHSSQLLSLPSL